MNRHEITQVFGPVWDAAGLRNFYGQGWQHSWILGLLGLDLRRSTFVSKTTTAYPREGNTPLRTDLKTRDFFPQSVMLKPWGGHTLNAWGLSGPGAEVILEGLARRAERGEYDRLQISFMPVGEDPLDLIQQTKMFTALLKSRLSRFAGIPLALQLNASCPNTGHNLDEFLRLFVAFLEYLGDLGLPILVKESADTMFELMWEIANHRLCAGIVTTNAVGFGKLSDRIPFEALYGTANAKLSPLAHMGGGGYSGRYLVPIVEERLAKYRSAGYDGHLNAVGGIRDASDVRRLRAAGADSFSIGSTLANYRPWNSRSVIREANSAPK